MLNKKELALGNIITLGSSEVIVSISALYLSGSKAYDERQLNYDSHQYLFCPIKLDHYWLTVLGIKNKTKRSLLLWFLFKYTGINYVHQYQNVYRAIFGVEKLYLIGNEKYYKYIYEKRLPPTN